jgi:hypothetical protein
VLIRESLWQDGSCIFGVMDGTAELLPLGERCRAGAQKFGGDNRVTEIGTGRRTGNTEMRQKN